METVLQTLEQVRIIPVVSVEEAETGVKVARALKMGGLPVVEITFRTKGAAAVIAEIGRRCPDILVGAGTVLTTDQVEAAFDAGAKFAVSPGLNPEVVKRCQALGMPMIPGVATPTEIELALSMGVSTVKLFPAEVLGGPSYIRALSAPYKMVRFLPTGGVNTGNLTSYLKLPSVIACAGSWMVEQALLASEKYDEITKLAREAVKTASAVERR